MASSRSSMRSPVKATKTSLRRHSLTENAAGPAAHCHGLGTPPIDIRADLFRRTSNLFGGNLRGPVAVPGSYQVRLIAAGETKSASFDIKKDPRIDASPEDFQKQFDMLIQIRDRVSDAHEGVNQILAVKKDLEKVSSDDKNISRQVKEVDEKLTAVLNELVELRFRGIDDQMLVYPLQLNAKIISLQRVLAGADRVRPIRPSRSSICCRLSSILSWRSSKPSWRMMSRR